MPSISRLFTVAVVAAAVSLPAAGCGRKGPLVPPADVDPAFPRQYPQAEAPAKPADRLGSPYSRTDPPIR